MLIIVSLLIAMALVYRFLPDLRELIWSREEIQLKETKIKKYRRMVDLGKDLELKLNALNKALDGMESRLLSGKTPSLAGVEIKEIIEKIVSKSNAQVARVRVLTPKELDKSQYLSISVNFALTPSIRKLKEILYGIESSRIFLKVTELAVRYHGSLKWDVQCQLTVAGLMKQPKSKKPDL
ncbi:MAG: type II secretion system protein GspM [Desulfobacteraceae bacterium]